MIEIAKVCQGKFEVLFASYGGRFEHLIREEGFVLREVSPRLTEEKIKDWYRVDRGEKFGTYFTQQELHERVENEIAFLREIKPAAVVPGFCLSVSIIGAQCSPRQAPSLFCDG